MVQFYYLRLYLGIKTASCLLQMMAKLAQVLILVCLQKLLPPPVPLLFIKDAENLRNRLNLSF